MRVSRVVRDDVCVVAVRACVVHVALECVLLKHTGGTRRRAAQEPASQVRRRG